MPETFEQFMLMIKEVDIAPQKAHKTKYTPTELVSKITGIEASLADVMKLILRYIESKETIDKDTLALLERHDIPAKLMNALYAQYPQKYAHFIVPLRIYIKEDSPEKFESIVSAALRLSKIEDIYFGFPGARYKGSIYQSFLGAYNIFIGKARLAERLDKIESEFEAQHIGKSRAKIDNELSIAVSVLINAMSSVDEGAINLGSLVVIKLNNGNKSQIIAFNMTETQLIILDGNPDLLKTPSKLLKMLQDHSQDKSSDQAGQARII